MYFSPLVDKETLHKWVICSCIHGGEFRLEHRCSMTICWMNKLRKGCRERLWGTEYFHWAKLMPDQRDPCWPISLELSN
jgi:hypothetical protein